MGALFSADAAPLPPPLRPELREFSERWLHPELRAAAAAAGGVRARLERAAGGVWRTRLLSDEFCALFAEEVTAMRPVEALLRGAAEAKKAAAPKSKGKGEEKAAEAPRSASGYDVNLSNHGFDGFFAQLAAFLSTHFLQPVHPHAVYEFSTALLAVYAHGSGTAERHSLHEDLSDLTVNALVAGDFGGSELEFAVDPLNLQFALSRVREVGGAAEDVCGELMVRVPHRRGYALLHDGHHLHAAAPITKGWRANIVAWFTQRTYFRQFAELPAELQQVVVDHMDVYTLTRFAQCSREANAMVARTPRWRSIYDEVCQQVAEHKGKTAGRMPMHLEIDALEVPLESDAPLPAFRERCAELIQRSQSEDVNAQHTFLTMFTKRIMTDNMEPVDASGHVSDIGMEIVSSLLSTPECGVVRVRPRAAPDAKLFPATPNTVNDTAIAHMCSCYRTLLANRFHRGDKWKVASYRPRPALSRFAPPQPLPPFGMQPQPSFGMQPQPSFGVQPQPVFRGPGAAVGPASNTGPKLFGKK